MNNSRVVFKPGWLLSLAVISIAFMALAFWPATSNTAEAQSGGPGNAGRGGGGHDKGAWTHCMFTITGTTSLDPTTAGAINAALAKLNAREAGGHHYTLLEVIACGIHSKRRCKDSDDKRYAFRFVVEDEEETRFEKNVRVCHE